MLFTWVMIGLFVAFVLGILALGLYSPRSGADVLDWRPSRPAEDPEEEAAQMLEAVNALRRRRESLPGGDFRREFSQGENSQGENSQAREL
ncbi:MAG TPA: hypothetical protein VD836_02800 [Solirubrobacteraceae bacterium]|nr:hypothetical protein [Solirubrobacteraceae bacterium]